MELAIKRTIQGGAIKSSSQPINKRKRTQIPTAAKSCGEYMFVLIHAYGSFASR